MVNNRVAVIIPCGGNHAQYVDEAVDSCLKVDPRPDEIIVIDDCAVPPVLKLEAQLNGDPPGLQLHRLDRHKGRSYARNYGVGMCDSPWLYFLDADDLLEPTAIADFKAITETQPESDLIYADYDYLDGDGQRHRVAKQIWVRDEHSQPHQAAKRTWVHRGRIPPKTGTRNLVNIGMFVKRARFCGIGGFDEEMAIAEYWDFFLRYVTNPRIKATKHTRPFFVARPLSTAGEDAGELMEGASRKMQILIRRGYYGRWRRV